MKAIIMGTTEYMAWLERKLNQYQITETYLRALVIALENTIAEESAKITGIARRPFYALYHTNGTRERTRAWRSAAELALWLKYKNYPPAEFFQAVCSTQRVAGWLRHQKQQPPLNVIMPSFRKSGSRLRKYEDHYLKWRRARYA